jgi:hypothetical protein
LLDRGAAMFFPFSLSGSFTVSCAGAAGDARAIVLDRATDLLNDACFEVDVEGDRLVASAELWLISAWPSGRNHPMIPIDRIAMTVGGSAAQAKISYTLGLHRVFIIFACFAAFATIMLCANDAVRRGWDWRALGEAILFNGAVLCGLCVVTALATWVRAPAFLRRKLRPGPG